MAKPSIIPFTYRFFHLYFEPIIALGGVLMLRFAPELFIGSLLPKAKYTSTMQPILDQLAGAWLFLAFSEAFILRETDDIRIWKLHLFGLLLSDAMYFWSYYLAMGHEVFFNPMLWRLEDWGNILLTCGPFFRIAFLFDVGLGRAKAAERAKKAQ